MSGYAGFVPSVLYSRFGRIVWKDRTGAEANPGAPGLPQGEWGTCFRAIQ
jgi:hypothetical protein